MRNQVSKERKSQRLREKENFKIWECFQIKMKALFSIQERHFTLTDVHKYAICK